MTTKSKILEIEADLKWDTANRQWVATAKDPAGKTVVMRARSTTKAVRRLGKVMEADLERPVEIKPKLQIPSEIKTRYNEYDKKLKLFNELKDFITRERRDLAIDLCNDFQMPITTVAPLIGLSSQRLGMLMQEFEMGLVPGKTGRPKARSDDDDDDD